MKTHNTKKIYHKRNTTKTVKVKETRNKINTKIPACKTKILPKGYAVYASKQFDGSQILEYNQTTRRKYKDNCLMENSSWFGNLEVAKYYNTTSPKSHIYKWMIHKNTPLLDITPSNRAFIDTIFRQSTLHLEPTISIPKKDLSKITYNHPYLHMTPNERALFEFQFCFGFIDVHEQFEFMKCIQYLIENKFIDIKRRNDESIYKKLLLKIYFYQLYAPPSKTNRTKMNRLSFYDLDKHAIRNLCRLTQEQKLPIYGVYQKNTTSFWFPNTIIQTFNLLEYIFFNPVDVLTFDKLVE
jgi:hypothetical protein